jgi:hypothetical protein
MRTGSKFGQITPAEGEAFFTSAINPMSPPAAGPAQGGQKIAPFAVLQPGVAQIPRRQAALRQPRDFEFFLLHNFVQNILVFHKFNLTLSPTVAFNAAKRFALLEVCGHAAFPTRGPSDKLEPPAWPTTPGFHRCKSL